MGADGPQSLARARREGIPLPEIGDGWRELTLPEAKAGSRYAYRIDEGLLVPDPASRFQPEDVPGRSMVVDPKAHSWSDAAWRGRPFEEAVIYEVHVGTATPQGSYAALSRKLDELADEGLTAIELMPIADFPGRRNWGYDGVLPFAPDASYGAPHELKRLIDRAHGLNLMVFINVVYNHFGPSGNHLPKYAGTFFTNRHLTPWGDAINFDGENSRHVREFFIHNALYWLEEFHVDGLRFDAVHAIKDESGTHVLAEIAARVRRQFPERQVHLVLENDANEARWLARDAQGRPRRFTAQWNDDFHHAWHILATGEKEGYYGDYADDPVKRLGRTLAEGFAYQGEASAHREGRARGEVSAHLPPSAFVAFLQNHDQIGNRAFGERLSHLVEPKRLALAQAVLLLSPRFRCSSWGRIGRLPPLSCSSSISAMTTGSRPRYMTAGVANFPVSAPLPTRRRPRRFPIRRRKLPLSNRGCFGRNGKPRPMPKLLPKRSACCGCAGRRSCRSRGMPIEARNGRCRPLPLSTSRGGTEGGSLRLLAHFGEGAVALDLGEDERVLWISAEATLDARSAHLPSWTGAMLKSTR